MPSNTTLNAGSGGDVYVSKERTHDGDAAKQQGVFLSGVSGTEGSYTFTDIQAGAGTAANALRTTLASDDPAVAVLGATSDAASSGAASISAKLRFIAATGIPVTALPALAAGTNNIGDVDVLTVPTDPFGANADAASATGSISAKLRFIAGTGIPITSLPALPAGTNAIGKLAANTGVTIGAVEIAASQTLGTVTTVTTLSTLTGGGVASGGADSGNPVKIGGRYNSTPPTLTNGQRGDLQLDAAGNTKVAAQATSIGGYTPGRIVAAASTNTGFIKNGAGTLGWLLAINLTSAVKYLKLYNKASAPTLASDTPALTIPIPANSTAGAGIAGGIPPQGLEFSTGIAHAITGAIGDTDTTALAANDVVVLYGYK